MFNSNWMRQGYLCTQGKCHSLWITCYQSTNKPSFIHSNAFNIVQTRLLSVAHEERLIHFFLRPNSNQTLGQARCFPQACTEDNRQRASDLVYQISIAKVMHVSMPNKVEYLAWGSVCTLPSVVNRPSVNSSAFEPGTTTRTVPGQQHHDIFLFQWIPIKLFDSDSGVCLVITLVVLHVPPYKHPNFFYSYPLVILPCTIRLTMCDHIAMSNGGKPRHLARQDTIHCLIIHSWQRAQMAYDLDIAALLQEAATYIYYSTSPPVATHVFVHARYTTTLPYCNSAQYCPRVNNFTQAVLEEKTWASNACKVIYIYVELWKLASPQHSPLLQLTVSWKVHFMREVAQVGQPVLDFMCRRFRAKCPLQIWGRDCTPICKPCPWTFDEWQQDFRFYLPAFACRVQLCPALRIFVLWVAQLVLVHGVQTVLFLYRVLLGWSTWTSNYVLLNGCPALYEP